MTPILSSLFILFMLVLLQAVLGFDNLLYISLESKRAPEDQRASVRKWGIAIAIGLRIVLLFILVNLIKLLKDPFFEVQTHAVSAQITLHSLIVLLGGVFIIYTALKEIMHMIAIENLGAGVEQAEPASAQSVIIKIIIMNLIFSFDSILSAMTFTDSTLLMTLAIIISGVMMIWLADHVAEFLQKNRMYEVLGLFILLIVGVMLLSEGGHKAHLQFFGHPVEEMSKTTFYFVIVTLVLIDIVQGKYQKKLHAEQARAAQANSN